MPDKWLNKADEMIQERIETSVDEEEYANGDWAERIYELAGELWAQDEEDRKCAEADHAIDAAKERQRIEPLPPTNNERE